MRYARVVSRANRSLRWPILNNYISPRCGFDEVAMGLADEGGRLGDLVLWGLFIFTVFFSAERLIELLRWIG